MKITSVEVLKFEKEGSRVRGFAKVVIDDCLMIHNIRIIEKDNEMIIAMPSRKKNEDTHMDVVHPLNAETRKMFVDRILEEYRKL